MGTFSATANSSSTIGYAQYGSSSWSTGSSGGACQGAYHGTTAAKSRVGVMVFSGAGAALKGKLIQSITLTITSSGAGSGSSSKKLTFCQANYQSLNTGVRGSTQVGATMGTLTGKFYRCPCGITGRTRCTRRKSTGNGRWRERLNPGGGYRNGWRTRTPFRLFR